MQKLIVIAKKEQVSEKDLNILFHAYYMIMRVYRNLSYTIDSDLSSSIWDLDPSLIIDESPPKVENELNFICNNMTNHTIKEAISQHLVKFADLTLSSWRYGDSRPVNSGIRAKGIKTTQQFMINHQSRKPAMDEKRQRKEDQKERKRKKQRLLFLVVAQEHRTCSSEFKRRDEPI
ncbi:hypothetical protein Tco_0629729 [Tanacetum coccineum]|uniref:Uncharacterized protein n=1 Tax=Tanacetum coccineum TaxID=301880 RepID=A0ABQ4WU20_9ASTR